MIPRTRQNLIHWLSATVICICAVIGALLLIQSISSGKKPGPVSPQIPGVVDLGPSIPGIIVTIRADGIETVRRLPLPAFGLEFGESLDSRIPPGEFEVELAVTFSRGIFREAFIGAEIAGGSVIIFRDGELLQSSYAAEKSKLTLSNSPVMLSHTIETITYQFRSDGGPVRFRALWQPLEESEPRLLPVTDDPLKHDAALRGMALAQRLNCAACHASKNSNLQAKLLASPPPGLERLVAGYKPDWLMKWLDSTPDRQLNYGMPGSSFRHDLPAESREAIFQFLNSLKYSRGETSSTPPPGDSPALIAQGRHAYHTLGCVACHAPLESTEEVFDEPSPPGFVMGTYRRLVDLGKKYERTVLEDMLLDSESYFPSGKMPSMSLSETEASSIAAYLISQTTDPETQENEIASNPDLIERGRVAFGELRCVHCHQGGATEFAGITSLNSTPLEQLSVNGPAQDSGCLAPSPPSGLPVFLLNESDRSDLKAFLNNLDAQKHDHVPVDEYLLALGRLNCISCHQTHAGDGPEPAIKPYYRFLETHADMDGLERFPPSLIDAGARLTPDWLEEVLVDGVRSRPQMATRMPRYPSGVIADFARWLEAVSGAPRGASMIEKPESQSQ